MHSIGEPGGIVIDNPCRTSDPHICAIGECALWQNQTFGLVAHGYQMAPASITGAIDPAAIQRRSLGAWGKRIAGQRTGVCLEAPEHRAAVYPVRVRNGFIQIQAEPETTGLSASLGTTSPERHQQRVG